MSSTTFSPDKKEAIGTFLMKWAPYIIVAITAILYSNALFNEFCLFDDHMFILDNHLVKDGSLSGIAKIFTTFSNGKYQPLTTLSFALEYRCFGPDPFPFHLTDVVLHLLSTFVVFKIVLKLSKNTVTAIVASLLFGIHPMHVEDVAWASERKDVLYAFFYLLSVNAYLRYIETGRQVRGYIAVFVLFLCALFSKTEAMTLPLLFLLIDIYQRRKITWMVIAEKLPILAFSLFFGLLSILSQQTDGVIGHHTVANYSFIDHIFLFTTVPAFYIIRLVAPFHLSAMHLYPDLHNGLLPWWCYASLPFLLLIVWLVVRPGSLRRERIFGALFFVVTICIMPQLIYTGPSITPERYSYIPYIGLCYIIGQLAAQYASTKWQTHVVALLSCFIVMCAVQTWLRIGVWKDSKTLYTDMIEKNADVADCSYFYWVRGNDYLGEQNYTGAIDDFDHVVAQHASYADAYAKRGMAYFQTGNGRAAIADFDTAIHIQPNNPVYYYSRASLKTNAGNLDSALQDYNMSVKLDEHYSAAYSDRGYVRLSLKDSLGACEDWHKAVSLGNNKPAQLIRQLCR